MYLCYGIHHLFNVVTAREGIPHAILIRALTPMDGIPYMLQRRGHQKVTKNLCKGPGTLSQALGIRTEHSGLDICDETSNIWICQSELSVSESRIRSDVRIGIDYAGDWAEKPWRFILEGPMNI